jgi:CubicO group peptidase (beta-lactamase class C family)
MFCSASLAAAAVVAIIGVAEAGIGPGRTGWQSVQAEKFGINSTKLEAAAAELHDAAAVRNCTLIVKDGYIIHESYDSWSNAESLFESDSMGKTAIAAVIGIAEYKGLLDIDEPVAKYYNDDSRASWNQSGTNFFPKVTLRHILSQASGYGRVEPGSFFTYDSEDYIMYLSYVIGAVTGEEPVVWATRELADPLGVGSLFMFDGLPGGDFR